jgi:hypothetical protein
MGHTQREQTLAYAKLRDPKLTEAHERVMGPILDRLLGGRFPVRVPLREATKGGS